MKLPNKLLALLILLPLLSGFLVGHFFLEEREALASKENFESKELLALVGELENKINHLEEKLISESDVAYNPEPETRITVSEKEKREVEEEEESPEEREEIQEAEENLKKRLAYVRKRNGYINIREQIGTDKRIIDKAYSGDVLEILDEKNRWYQVKLKNEKIGWVASWIVEADKE